MIQAKNNVLKSKLTMAIMATIAVVISFVLMPSDLRHQALMAQSIPTKGVQLLALEELFA